MKLTLNVRNQNVISLNFGLKKNEREIVLLMAFSVSMYSNNKWPLYCSLALVKYIIQYCATYANTIFPENL